MSVHTFEHLTFCAQPFSCSLTTQPSMTTTLTFTSSHSSTACFGRRCNASVAQHIIVCTHHTQHHSAAATWLLTLSSCRFWQSMNTQDASRLPHFGGHQRRSHNDVHLCAHTTTSHSVHSHSHAYLQHSPASPKLSPSLLPIPARPALAGVARPALPTALAPAPIVPNIIAPLQSNSAAHIQQLQFLAVNEHPGCASSPTVWRTSMTFPQWSASVPAHDHLTFCAQPLSCSLTTQPSITRTLTFTSPHSSTACFGRRCKSSIAQRISTCNHHTQHHSAAAIRFGYSHPAVADFGSQ